MTKLIVCTGWNLEGWVRYGRRFLETFVEHWPSEVRLEVYGEEDAMAASALRAMELARAGKLQHDVRFTHLRAIEGCVEFLERHRGDPMKCGRAKSAGHPWKERAVVAGYNWRYDAVKFSRQGFIPHAVATDQKNTDADFLCWLDGDVVTHSRVASAETITKIMPTGKAIAFLGREPKHPDIAFQLYDLREPRALQFLQAFRLAYELDLVFTLKEWHSAFVWRHLLQHHPQFLELAYNMTPQGSGHVWHQSVLRFWGDHLKGDRKERGRSPERR